MKRYILILGLVFITGILFGPAHAAMIDLSFAGADVTYSGGVSGDLSIYIANAATVGTTNIDVRITSLNTYMPDTPEKGNGTEDVPPGNNGSVTGDDLRIHLNAGTSTRFRFELLNQSSGELFDPAELSYDLLVYDLDGNELARGGADVLTVFASSFQYVVTQNTALSVVEAGGGYTFSDTDAGEILGQTGLSQAEFAASVAQQNISVGITFYQPLWEFEYAVPASDSTGTGRNLLFDAGDLSFTEPTTTVMVPEPAAMGLITLGGFLTLAVARFRRISREY